MDVRYDRPILSMDDEELEQFCRAWVEKKLGYFEVRRYAGTGDLGLDVVGFLTDQRHDVSGIITSASNSGRNNAGFDGSRHRHCGSGVGRVHPIAVRGIGQGARCKGADRSEPQVIDNLYAVAGRGIMGHATLSTSKSILVAKRIASS